MAMKYRRILLKLSGEALLGDRDYGIDPQMLRYLAGEIKTVYEQGVQIGIVIGGGNIYRGIHAKEQGIDKVTGDYMGMLATVINALALQNVLEKHQIPTRLQTAIMMQQIAEPFIRRRAIRHLEKGRIVLFGAGTGSPYFTTDTAASLRAIEINAEVIIKATKVDGVYDADPLKVATAKKFATITYEEVLKLGLRVMDLTAITLAKENGIPIVVYNLQNPGDLLRVVQGESVGTTVVAA